MVRGWWSASNIIFSSSSQLIFSAIILLWSGVGAQVCYRSLEGPFRNAFGNIFLIYIIFKKQLPRKICSKRCIMKKIFYCVDSRSFGFSSVSNPHFLLLLLCAHGKEKVFQVFWLQLRSSSSPKTTFPDVFKYISF